MNEHLLMDDFNKLFFDENGNFIPLEAEDGNSLEELANFRNVFLESEREYFLQLLSNKRIRYIFDKFLSMDSESLLRYSIEMSERVENGELESREELMKMKQMSPEEREKYHFHKLLIAEVVIILAAATARDKVKMEELVKEFDSSFTK